jgi:hypothetical protein
MADQLVERVVAADVFARAARRRPRCTMLPRARRRWRVAVAGTAQLRRGACDGRLQRAGQRCGLDAFGLQIQAPGFRCRTRRSRCARHRAALLLELHEFLGGDGDVDLEAARMLAHFNIENVGSLRDQPSVRAKPIANGCRSRGVTIMTACEMPLKTSATGTSSITRSVVRVASAPRWRVTGRS